MGDLGTWVTFLASAAAVVAAGTQLARYGDRLARETGLGGLWIGAVLVAVATSLPEVVTVASAAWIEEPDLAVGDLFGSNMTNMMVLAVIALVYRRHRVWQAVSLGHILVASLAVALTSFAAAFVSADLGWSIGHVGLETLAIGLLYLLGTRVVFRHEYLEARIRTTEAPSSMTGGSDADAVRLRPPSWRSVLPFAAGAGVIFAAAPFLATSAADIAVITGLAESFVGVTFLAITTSLPELATSLAAVRLGSYDLAVGNLFGSNSFNVVALLFADVAYRPGPISADVTDAQIVAALVAVLLMALGMMAIIYRAERRFFLVEPDAAAIILGYIGGMWLVHQAGA